MAPAAVIPPAVEDDDDQTPPVEIDDDEVPLGVVGDDEEGVDDNTGAEEDLTDLEDDDTPLAAPVAEAAGRVWWSWIPVIGAVASAVEGYRQNKKAKEEAGESGKED